MGQVLAVSLGTSYYGSVLALTLRFFLSSFQSILPWAKCKPEWGTNCVDASTKVLDTNNSVSNLKSSAEMYF